MTLLRWDDGDAPALRRTIRETLSMTPRNAVLLLGRVPASPGDPGIPTFRLDQPDPALVDRRDACFASDRPYQDLDDDGAPDLMLGRVPAVDDAAARAILAKIRASESSPPEDRSARVEILGGEGRFGLYDALLELLTASLLVESVPPEYDLRVSYAKPASIFCPPPSRLRAIARDQALSGSLLFNYIGHGHAGGLDRLVWSGGTERILDVGDLAPSASRPSEAAVSAPAAPSPEDHSPGGVALLVCCSAGWFDLPGATCFAEAILAAPSGPVGVIAGSRPTHPYANAFVEREGVRSLLQERPRLLGEWDLAIMRPLALAASEVLDLVAAPIARSQRWKLPLREMRRQHAQLYNLIGDPTTRLIHAPQLARESLRIRHGGVVEGWLPGATDAWVEIRVVRMRTALRPDLPHRSGRVSDLEERASREWPLANDWTLWTTTVPLEEGRFEVALPWPPPKGAAQVVVRIRRPAPTAPTDPERESPGSGMVLLGIGALAIPPLLGSATDGQGLPSDRGFEPGGP